MLKIIDEQEVLKIIFNVMTDNKVRHKHRALNRNVKQAAVTPINIAQHAHWEYFNPLTQQCSMCGYLSSQVLYSNYNYCPNCGSKMDEKTEE